MTRPKSQEVREKALNLCKSHGGIIRTSEMLAAGIHRRILYELRDEGKLEEVMRGVFIIPGLPDVSQPDLAVVSKKVPVGVICLISALSFHELTVQIPRWIDIAIPPKYHPPRISYPPVQFHWFSPGGIEAGVEEYGFGGVRIKIFSKEKTIVDCFRLRRKVGVDIAVEALKSYWRQEKRDLELIRNFAKSSRVLRVMTPYIEAIIHD